MDKILNLTTQKNAKKKQKNKRNEKKSCFNTPYCKPIKTNIGKKFLKIVNKHFGENSKLKNI